MRSIKEHATTVMMIGGFMGVMMINSWLIGREIDADRDAVKSETFYLQSLEEEALFSQHCESYGLKSGMTVDSGGVAHRCYDINTPMIGDGS